MNKMCYHPWVSVDVTTQGNFKPCCKFSKPIATNLSDYLSSPELVKLKEQFTKGVQPIECKRCWDDELAGIPSKRQIDYNRIFQNKIPDLTKLASIGINFGNSCNLACRICSSYASSTWLNESKKLQNLLPNIPIFEHHRFYQDKELLTVLKTIPTDLRYVEFFGGEPFLASVTEQLELLDYLISIGASNTELHYSTNTSVLPNTKFWDKWAKFKTVDLALSIDGLGEHFEYQRWPAVWDDVVDNIKFYQEQTAHYPNIKISISHTVSIFNVYYIPEFTKWCLQQGLGKPFLSPLSAPEMYSIVNLPDQVKEQISEKLTRFNFQEIVKYMNNSAECTNEKFVEYTRVLDRHRDQNFTTTFSEFYQLLKDAGWQI